MTLKSALEDLTQTTLDAISGCLKRLEYLAGLRRFRGDYSHWGFAKVHGEPTAKKAIHEAHRAAISEVLSTPLATLLNDAAISGDASGCDTEEYLEGLARQQKQLLPNNPGAGSARHLSSVLNALLGLQRHRKRSATPRAS
jgi:signal transduction histidine kinase